MTPCSACSFPHAAPACPRCGAPATAAGYGAATAQAQQGWGGGYAPGVGVPPVPYAAPYAQPMGGELDTKNTMILAIVAFLFCQPAGIIAVIMAEEAKKLHRMGRPEDAQRKLGHAKLSVYIGLGISGLFILAYIALMIIAMVLTH